MKEVKLIFPNIELMTRFVFDYEIGHAIVNCKEPSLEGSLSDELIDMACSKYQATHWVPAVREWEFSDN